MTTKQKHPYLIIGNSAAAMGAIEGIRSVDDKHPITLIAKEPEHTYSRPLITYLLGGKVDEQRMPYRPAEFYENNNVNAILGTEVAKVVPTENKVITSDGEEYYYEKLLIAVGGNPIVPKDVHGVDAQGVFTFTTWQDAVEIQKYIEENNVQKAVIVGAGLIGLKSVEALLNLKISVTLVELADRVLSITFDETASGIAEKQLKSAGADVRCKTTVSSIQNQDGKVNFVTLQDGSVVTCGMVIFAIGVLPNVDMVRDCAIQFDRGILVDENLETAVAGVYAAGDVAQGKDFLDGSRRPIPILPVAYRQGLIAGQNMAGRQREYHGGIAMNAVDICGTPTISVGVTAPRGDNYEVLSTLDENNSVYKKIVLKDDRIVGAIFIGDVDRAGIFTGLIKDRTDVSAFKDKLLTSDFGLISLPREYRKHVVSGMGIEV